AHFRTTASRSEWTQKEMPLELPSKPPKPNTRSAVQAAGTSRRTTAWDASSAASGRHIPDYAAMRAHRARNRDSDDERAARLPPSTRWNLVLRPRHGSCSDGQPGTKSEPLSARDSVLP